MSLALGAEASFVARTVDSDRKHLSSVLAAAATHRGTALVEIYQNCPIFNDGAFDDLKGPDTKADAIIPLVHGEPIVFGTDGAKGLIRDSVTGGVTVALVADVDLEHVLVHDAHNPDPTTAFAISRLTDAGVLHQSPIGIFRQVQRPSYDDQARAQITDAQGAVTGSPEERSPRCSTPETPGPSPDRHHGLLQMPPRTRRKPRHLMIYAPCTLTT